MKKGWILLLFLTAGMMGCMPNQINPKEDFDFGATVDGVYYNKYFKFKLPLPTDWIQRSRAEIEGIDPGDTYAMREINNVYRATDIEKGSLLSIQKYHDTALVDFNPNMLLMVENVSESFTIKNGKDYLTGVEDALKRADLSYELGGKTVKQTMGNKEFYLLSVVVENPYGHVIGQQYYATVLKGFAVTAVLTYKQEADGVALASILNRIAFK